MTEKHSILMLRPRLDPYGVSVAIFGLSRALSSQGHHVIVAASNEESDTSVAALANAGIGYRKVPMGRRDPLSLIRSRRALARVVAEEGVSIIHSHHRWTTLIANPVARKARLPLVVTYHGIHRGKRRLSVWGDAVISVSENASRHLQDYFHVPAERITVIPNGIEMRPEKARPKGAVFNPKYQEGSVVYVHVARLSPEKDQITLIAAMELVCRRRPDSVLLIAGSGPSAVSVHREVSKRNLSGIVQFLGHVCDIPALLGCADVFVLSSRTEGFPMSILEAFASGLPVVATAVGDIPKLVAEGATGFTVPPGDPDALAEALLRLHDDERLRRTMGEAGQLLVHRLFDQATSARRTLDVYQKAAALI